MHPDTTRDGASRRRAPGAGPALGPLRLRPILVPRVWGGTRLLAEIHPGLSSAQPIGESWEVSDIGEGPEYHSVVDEGPARGRTLRDLLGEFPDEILGASARTCSTKPAALPLLYKFVDAAAPLSVQVHPSDSLMRSLGLSGPGKTEAWVVVDAAPGARIIYGLEKGVRYHDYLANARTGRGREGLRWVGVKKGDVIFLPAGTLHAVGAGLLLAEIQQSCDITYRIYDWDRPGLDGKPRALHLEQAARVVPPEPEPPCPLPDPGGDEPIRPRVENEHFILNEVRLARGSLALPLAGDRCSIVSVLEGNVQVEAEVGAPIQARRGTTLLLPACLRDVVLTCAQPSWALWMLPGKPGHPAH